MTTSTKSRRPVLDLQVNLPVQFTLKYADWFVHEEYGAKLKCAVNIAPAHASEAYPAGDYTHFFYPGAEDQLLAAGAISEMAERNGVRQFKVTGKPLIALKLTEVKAEDGHRRRVTKMLVDGKAPSGQAPAPPAPSAPAPRASAPAPHPTAGAKPATQPEDKNAARLEGWMALGEEYAVALLLAERGFFNALGEEVKVDPAVLQAGAATLMIRAERNGVLSYLGLLGDLLEIFNAPPAGPRDRSAEAAYSAATGHGDPPDDPFGDKEPGPGDMPESLEDFPEALRDDPNADLPF